MNFIKAFLFFILARTVITAQTQKNIDHQNLLWTRYYNQVEINPKWSIHSEFDNRVFLDSIVQNLFVIRVQGRHKISEQVELGAGIVYFSVATQVPEVNLGFNIPEYRLQQDLTWKKNWSKIVLNQRFQIEERFFQNADGQGLTTGTTFFWRFRYRLQGEYTFWRKEKRYLKAIVYDEIMINAGKNAVYNSFDQNRVYVGLQYGISSDVAVELGYMNSFQQRTTGIDYFDRNIIRLSIYHQLRI
ncbi:DUF2490 domain-containing protein [Flavobacterium branchiophilum]|uniref:DUF2490 domain-containing protein n=1 Tax=Flavobacterium branchiophilum (strain FL-15) TaxID=1034807 RepID=G2Z4C3_FLABF|nr:DUF2490 domain-containing protein [Flavobacterium branchiophilum]CCB70619.1 Protein of unknown function precursor [Flavobacterium branchiophilum FL-15]